MKRLRSTDDFNSYREKGIVKDWGRKDDVGSQRSSPSLHRSTSYYMPSESGRKVLSSVTSRYDRLEDDRESPKLVRKQLGYGSESYDRRKTQDRYRDGNERGGLTPSPRPTYGMDQMRRSESFTGTPRRDFPKGFRSERDRPKKEGVTTSWRRFGGVTDSDGTSRGSRIESRKVGKSKSPKGLRDEKSPAWSKDSGSERSKSVECKKYEDMLVDSGGPSSEREEGELEPDPQLHVPLSEPVIENKAAVEFNSSLKEVDNELCGGNNALEEGVSFLSHEKRDVSKLSSCEGQAEHVLSKDVEDDLNKNNNVPDFQDTSLQNGSESRDENDINCEIEGDNNALEDRLEGSLEEDVDSTCGDKLISQEQLGGSSIIEKKADDIIMTRNVEITAGSELPSTERMTLSLKDKGKSVALVHSDDVCFTETNLEAENRAWDLATSGDIEMEVPSTRGFQFFSTDPTKKPEKVEEFTHTEAKDDKLALRLSLSLPDVLLPIGSQSRVHAPGSPSHARSVQSFASSFRTNSDGFTASMSFSGSQQFTHNPSCSLTHNALDFEQSVKSKPLFQGVDWKALASEENKNNEVPAHQRISSRENGLFQQSQLSQGNSSGQFVVQNMRVPGGSSKLPIELEKQLSFNKHLSRAQSFGSYENGIERSTERKQLMTELCRSNGVNEKDQAMVIGADFAESIVTMVVSEPPHTMARNFSDMTGGQRACVKEFVLDIISNPGKQWQLSALQKALQKRPDITLDMLLNANRTQLEILVALKTGFRDFLVQKCDIPSSDLSEIFLNMRCRNLNCRSILPVDECDCKICARQSDFCRECMCLLCSKFDMASNTCSWVGCDVCLHWCHADCGLRESHIRNEQSATGPLGTTEIQFYCVACDHPSEMFGFVKEVFQNFVKEWTAENLSRELEYVRRLFCASEDVRGKHLHEISIRTLSKLANKADLQDVQNHIMNFFTATNFDRPGNNTSIESRKNVPTEIQNASNAIAESSLVAGWLKPVYPDKPAYLEKSKSLPELDSNRNENKLTASLDLGKNTKKEPVFDELESIVRIKQAEAKMFRTRAEDARRESEALKHIAVTKSERIEEEYISRITKLRLVEAEEMRKHKVQELQALERCYQEYFNMKTRMETDIKDLLLKMEATRKNLAV
ncbi:hypothetical protein OROGR_030282 [Orobanche gracilis]